MFKTTDTSYQSGSVDDYEVLGKYLTFNTPLTIMDIHMLHEYYDKCSYKNSNDKEITCSIHYSYQELLNMWQKGLATVTYQDKVYSIPANCDYKLKENESVTFFYKTTDSSEAPYTYKYYGEGTIIKPSFIARGVSRNDAKFNTTATTGIIEYSDIESDLYNKIASMFDYNELSGSKTIEIRDLNETNLKAADKYHMYFVTNNIITMEDGTLKYVLKPDNNGRYILNNDEYFIYTNAYKTSFEIFGAGTLLIFSQTDTQGNESKYIKELTINAIDYNKIAKDGLDSFTALCIPSVNERIDCTIREQQLYNFTENDKLIFTVNDNVRDSLLSNPNKEISGPFINTVDYTPISNYNITYDTEGTIGALPTFYIDGATESIDYSWVANATLNLKCSNTESQVLYEDTPYCKTSIKINDTEYKANNGNYYILSNIVLEKVGGINIDISYTDVYGQIGKPYIFIYKQLDEYKKSYFTKNYDDTITLNLSKISNNTSLPVGILKNNDEYSAILPIRNISDNIKFKLKEATAINSDETFYGNGIYYFRLDPNVEKFTLVYTDTPDTLDQITFEPIVKFKDNDIFKNKYGIDNQTILDRIKELDINNKFNYIYNVPTNDLIADPLESKTFFNIGHIFNDYTLPMADLYMSETSQSSINLINNR